MRCAAIHALQPGRNVACRGGGRASEHRLALLRSRLLESRQHNASLPVPSATCKHAAQAAAQPARAGSRASRGAAQRARSATRQACVRRSCDRRGMRRAAPRALLLALLLALLAGASGANYAKARHACASCGSSLRRSLRSRAPRPQHRAKRYGKNPRGGGKFDAMVRLTRAQTAERVSRGGMPRCACAERPTRRIPPSWRSAKSVTPPSERACAAAAAAALGERLLP